MNTNNKDLNNVLKTGGGINKSAYFNTLTNLTNSTVSLEKPTTNYFINNVDIGTTTCAYFEDYTTSGSINFSNSPYSNCIKINCLLVGGGGGGGDRGTDFFGNSGDPDFIDYTNRGSSGSGGASGSCASAQFLNPNGILTYTIGIGGIYRANNSALVGGDTTFTFQSQTVTALGGNGGLRGSNAGTNDGQEGTPVTGGTGRGFTNGTVNFGGNNGVQGGMGAYNALTQDSSDKLINNPWGSVQTINTNYGKSGVGILGNGYTNPRLSIDGSTGSSNGKNGFIRIYFFY